MSLDENVYSEPYSFSPTRFLPKPEGKGEPHFKPVFGYGRRSVSSQVGGWGALFAHSSRRVCPGRFLVNDSLWIAIATILATLTISNKLDENGNKIIPSAKMTEGLARYACSVHIAAIHIDDNRVGSHPADLKCHITPRSPQAEMLVLALDS